MSVTWLGVGVACAGVLVAAGAVFGPDVVWRIQRRRRQRAVWIEFGGRRLG